MTLTEALILAPIGLASVGVLLHGGAALARSWGHPELAAKLERAERVEKTLRESLVVTWRVQRRHAAGEEIAQAVLEEEKSDEAHDVLQALALEPPPKKEP